MSDRQLWQERHRSSAPRPAPSPFVAAHVARRAASGALGRALDVACGSGRHAALLREHGFATVVVDYASAACRRVASDVGARAVVADARALPFRDASFALIVQTLFLERALFPRLLALLEPGGMLLAETFLVEQHDITGHPRREFCLRPGELAHLCTTANGPVRVIESREGPVVAGGASSHLASIAVCKV